MDKKIRSLYRFHPNCKVIKGTGITTEDGL